jgi:IS30 family transposase
MLRTTAAVAFLEAISTVSTLLRLNPATPYPSFRASLARLPRLHAHGWHHDADDCYLRACHQDFTRQTLIPVYFCDPASPWQRGLQHADGLVKTALTDFDRVTA